LQIERTRNQIATTRKPSSDISKNAEQLKANYHQRWCLLTEVVSSVADEGLKEVLGLRGYPYYPCLPPAKLMRKFVLDLVGAGRQAYHSDTQKDPDGKLAPFLARLLAGLVGLFVRPPICMREGGEKERKSENGKRKKETTD